MCGISGIVGFRDLPPEALRARVREMGLWQFHRGPDAWGEWVGEHIAFGHNRLAILDIEGGAQPMVSGSGEIRVLFNGEIYNFRELRRELEQKGHRFRTDHSDTEVIVEGYAEWGTGVFERLEGMFAIALWDGRQRTLVLARDRAGIKPLYYARTDGGLVFASEPKAILASGLVGRTLRAEGLLDYFMFRAAVGPSTLVEGVDKLPPGHWRKYSADGELRPLVPFWSPAAHRAVAGSVEEASEALLSELEGAVTSHLVADVPVGVFLSGGVDSSLVAALAAKHAETDAFTIGTDSALDESGFARTVADHLGLRLRVRRVTPEDFLGRFDAWSYYNDDPVLDPSALALMILSDHAREHGMKVMLAGEGADELFGGYPSYQRFWLHRRLGALPFAGRVGPHIADRVGGKDGDYLRRLPRPPFMGHAHITDDIARQRLFQPGLRSRIAAWEESAFPPPIRGAGPVREAMLFDQGVRLPNDVLPRTDRATMAASLEARVPFLDRRIVELANGLPDRWCVRTFPPERKWLLKRLAARFVPPEVVYRPKLGFDLPIDRWLQEDFHEQVEELLIERVVPQLDYEYLDRLYHSPARWSKRWAALIWGWIVLERWYRLWIGGTAEPLRPAFVTSPATYRELQQRTTTPLA